MQMNKKPHIVKIKKRLKSNSIIEFNGMERLLENFWIQLFQNYLVDLLRIFFCL